MKYLLVLAFWSIGFAAEAQHMSAGLRGSANLMMQRNGKAGIKPLAGTGATIAPEAFLRYQGKKSWAAEFAVTTDRMQQQYWWTGMNEIQAPGLIRTTYNTRSVEAAINLQREIRCQRLSSVPALKKLHSYVGVGTSLAHMQQQGIALSPSGETKTQNSEYWYHWISLSKTIRYDVSKNFSLQTGGQCGMNTMTMFRSAAIPEPSLRFSVQLGASYNW